NGILAEVLVLIVPSQNPDGRARFLAHFEQTRGPEPDSSPFAAEHNEAWPGGRGNHYLFDLNRDWIALTQPEIASQVKALLEWYPLVYVDLHEMGSDSTYFFAPEADPFNPHLTRTQRDNLKLFGRNNARWFDRYGFDYFTREVFDAFYPGYGASWPAYHGAIAMTYEQASVRGLVVRRSDETDLHFRDSVRHHFVASIATAETAAKNREKLLTDFYRYRQSAIAEGNSEAVREYILPRGPDAAAVQKLAGILAEQGVEVKRAVASFSAGGREYPAGSYVIPLAQPAKRLVRTLLDPHVGMDEPFLKEQERRRSRKLPDEIYDVTAWSLPLMFNVECVARPEPSQGRFEPVAAARIPAGRVTGGKAEVAYLVPWGTAAAGRLLAAAHRASLRVFSSDKAFSLDGEKFPAGTLIFKVKDNPADLGERLAKLAAQSGAEVKAAGSSWVDEGVNFGSRYVIHLRKPAVAMAWDTPVSSQSAGFTRFVLERQFGYPVTVIRASQLGSVDLSRFDVLILPGAGGRGYASVLGDSGAERLKNWVSGGGVLVGIGEALGFLADKKVDLLSVAQENAARAEEPRKEAAPAKPAAPADARVPGKLLASESDYRKSIQAEKELPDAASGALLRARIDPDHWLGAGAPAAVNALVEGRAIYRPITLDKGTNVAVFQGPDQIVASGYLWEENRKQLAHKPLVMAQPRGRGVVIGFAADPNFRAYLDGMNVLFLNAVFRSVRK
ncbi:MAG: peptidase M14, partial [Bryobacterales bacterium]|nr:peptidase M14 [Bryobacterales bacterium]